MEESETKNIKIETRNNKDDKWGNKNTVMLGI